MADRTIHHSATCLEPSLYDTTGHLGDLLTRCRNCGRFAVVAVAVAPAAPEPEPEPRPAARAVLTIPGVGGHARRGDAWPTHKAKARRQNAAR